MPRSPSHPATPMATLPTVTLPTVTPGQRAPRRAPRPLPLRLGPLLIFEIGLLVGLIVLAAGAPLPAAVVPVVAGLGLAVLRIRGRAVDTWLAVWLRYRIRHRRPGPAATPPQVSGHLDRSSATLGVLAGDEALDMVLSVTTSDAVPVGMLEEALTDGTVPLASIRVVTTYRRHAATEPLVVVRLRPADCPAAVLARGGGAEGARRALSAAATRLARRLSETGRPAHVLTPMELTGVFPADTVESWDHCQAGGHRHVGYRLARWPSGAETFTPASGNLPCRELTTALLLERAGREIRRTGTLRMLDPAERGTAASMGRKLGVRLIRLDGEHAAALALTIAGGA